MREYVYNPDPESISQYYEQCNIDQEELKRLFPTGEKKRTDIVFDYNEDAYFCEHCKRNIQKVIITDYTAEFDKEKGFKVVVKSQKCHSCKKKGTLRII